jgi:hypothetical protein
MSAENLRDLNVLVTRRANRMFKGAQADAQDEGYRLTLNIVASRMADQSGNQSSATVRKHLGRLMKGDAAWRASDMQRFAIALGRSVQGLISDDSNVPEATAAGQLFHALNAKLKPKELRDLLELIVRGINDRGIYDLSRAFALLAHESTSRGQLVDDTITMIRESPIFEADTGKRIYASGTTRRPKRSSAPPPKD